MKFYYSLLLCCILSCTSTQKSTITSENSLNGSYQVISLLNEDVTSKKITISFNDIEHIASGNASCNSYSSKYSSDKKNISFSQQTTTKKFCPSGMKYEQLFLNTLNTITTKEIQSDKLLLYKNDGVLAIIGKKIN